MIDRYFSAFNSIENYNRMQLSDLVLDKYWLTQSGYFRLETTFDLGMGITDWKLLFCHVISDKIKDNTFSTREYNGRIVYDCFNNNFPITPFFSPIYYKVEGDSSLSA